MRLALALGWSNPDAMLASMPTRVYEEWKAFGREEPFWEERADYRAALIAYTVAANTPRKKNARAPKFSDFLLKFGTPIKADVDARPHIQGKAWPTGQQLYNKLAFMTRMYGGTITDERDKN